MSSHLEIADVIEAFKQRGFEFVGKSGDGWFRLHGRIVPQQAEAGFSCEVQLDPTFVNFPRIKLLEIPPSLSGPIPHLGADGSLCYLAKGSVVLDIYDPVGQTLACLQRAAFVIGQILKGEMIDDLVEEFFAYWQGIVCFVDIQGETLGRQNCIVAKVDRDGDPLCFITDNEARTTQKLKLLGLQVTDKTVLTYRVQTSAQPRPSIGIWPPATVGELLAWQGNLDPRCRNKILQRIKDGKSNRAGGVLIVIESPLMTYGIVVMYDRQRTASKGKISARQNATYGLKVIPATIVRIDDRYLAQRNMPNSKTLEGKQIAIVGCGTIGGFLADMLVKAGAGTCGGRLTLVDFDYLAPQNIGRHRLGFPDLLSNKAEAMANELKRMAPGAEICALPVDVRQAQLGNIDLLIDATGEESLGHWLCAHYPQPLPMLSVWIEGPGTAVRGLLRQHKSGACFRCLWHSNKRDELRSTIQPLPVILAGQGCEGLYVPFPASVSVHAASLGAEMTLDWVNDVYSPALRTRLVDRAMELATTDCDPLIDHECPICNS